MLNVPVLFLFSYSDVQTMLLYRGDGNVKHLRNRQMRNFLVALFMSAGTPMILGKTDSTNQRTHPSTHPPTPTLPHRHYQWRTASKKLRILYGDEYGRSQRGCNNGWCQDARCWFSWRCLVCMWRVHRVHCVHRVHRCLPTDTGCALKTAARRRRARGEPAQPLRAFADLLEETCQPVAPAPGSRVPFSDLLPADCTANCAGSNTPESSTGLSSCRTRCGNWPSSEYSFRLAFDETCGERTFGGAFIGTILTTTSAMSCMTIRCGARATGRLGSMPCIQATGKGYAGLLVAFNAGHEATVLYSRCRLIFH